MSNKMKEAAPIYVEECYTDCPNCGESVDLYQQFEGDIHHLEGCEACCEDCDEYFILTGY